MEIVPTRPIGKGWDEVLSLLRGVAKIFEGRAPAGLKGTTQEQKYQYPDGSSQGLFLPTNNPPSETVQLSFFERTLREAQWIGTVMHYSAHM